MYILFRLVLRRAQRMLGFLECALMPTVSTQRTSSFIRNWSHVSWHLAKSHGFLWFLILIVLWASNCFPAMTESSITCSKQITAPDEPKPTEQASLLKANRLLSRCDNFFIDYISPLISKLKKCCSFYQSTVLFLMPVLRRWGYKSIPGNIVSSRLAWTRVDPVSKGKQNQTKINFVPEIHIQ